MAPSATPITEAKRHAGDFSGRVVLVTGAARGIGRACAELLARAGGSVALAARSEPSVRAAVDELSKSGFEVLAVHGDLGVRGVADAYVEAAIRRFGRLDALIHCAGIFASAPAAEQEDDGFEGVVRTNLYGSFYAARAAARAMSGEGSVVLVSSMWALRGGAGRTAYCASKAGVEALARVLNGEWSPRVHVYCVAPGWVATERIRAMIASGALDQAAIDAVAPDRALLEPGEVARVCLALASGEHPMLAGNPIRLDGGLTSWIPGV